MNYHDTSEVQQMGYSPNPFVKLVRSGTEYFNLLEKLILEANHTIHLQTYIFDEDDTGKQIAKALRSAARRGVKVMVIADGYASQELSAKFINRLRKRGVYFRYFHPLFKSRNYYFGRRLHHKVVVIDGFFSLVGGINIGNHYNDTVENVAWLDWALYVEGSVSLELQKICERRFQKSFVKSLKLKTTQDEHLSSGLGEPYWVRPRINDWVRRRKEVTASYLEMLEQARSQVIIMSSYFLPGIEFRKAIRKAVKRGVEVCVIVAGISDVKMAKLAERYMYGWMLRNKIQIYEYQRKILHAKVAVYDGKWCTVGSYNVNNISAYASVELNIDVLDIRLAHELESRLQRIIDTDCIRVTDEKYKKSQNLWNRYLQRSAYDIFRIVLFLFTFYFKQRD